MPVTQKYKYKAFISYSHADQNWARWLHRTLESYRTPTQLVGTSTPAGIVPARISPVFRDRDELASSPDLSERINKALESSENLIAICSPGAAASRWVNQEIESFKKLGRSDRIFCVIVGGDPGSAADCFPPAITARYDDNGVLLPGDTEPIAADARKQGDGKPLAGLKILAGLLGVGLDDLRQRELQRKQRRMLAITSGSALVASITIVLAVTAFLARIDADQRRMQAEDLLGFMVGDLRSSLTPIGRLDLLEDVGEQAMSYFASVDVGNLTDGELLRQAQVMTQLGEIRFSQLQYDDALSSFLEAYTRSSALQSKNPTDEDRLFNRSQAEFWVGFVHWRSGNLDAARDWLTRYRDSSLQLYSLDPTNTDWIREVGYGYHNMAVLDQEMGNLEASIEGLTRELETLGGLRGLDDNSSLIRDMADAYSWLGNIAVMQGELARATGYYERTVREIQSISDQDPDNAVWLEDLAFAVHVLAETSLITGELDKAEGYIDASANLFEGLVERDANNANWVRALSKPRISRGYLLQVRSRFSDAREIANQEITQLEELLAQGTQDHNIHDHLADAYQLVAWTHQSTNEIELALDASRNAILHLETLRADGRLNIERVGKLAAIHIFRGELLAALGEDKSAEESLMLANELLSETMADSESPFILDPWARLLILRGSKKEAGQIIDALQAHRYLPLRPWPD